MASIIRKDEWEELKALDPANSKCFDCKSPNPNWASINNGIYLCLNCSGYHRSLGVHLSKLRSLTLDNWNKEQLAVMKVGGNGKAKAFYASKGIDKLGANAKYASDEASEYRETLGKLAKEYLADPAKFQFIPVLQNEPVPEVVEPELNIEPEIVDVSVKSAKGITEDEHFVLITAAPPPGQARTPVDICCVIDISGSMDTLAEMKNAEGGVESHGLSLLDVVKHAVKTISCSLGNADRLAIVVFSSNARAEMSLRYANDMTKKKDK